MCVVVGVVAVLVMAILVTEVVDGVVDEIIEVGREVEVGVVVFACVIFGWLYNTPFDGCGLDCIFLDVKDGTYEK